MKSFFEVLYKYHFPLQIVYTPSLLTLAPLKFSWTNFKSLSFFLWILLYFEIQNLVISKTIKKIIIVIILNIKPILVSIKKAIIIEPSTINGERNASLKSKFMPFWTCKVSEEIILTILSSWILSKSLYEKLWIWLNNLFFNLLPIPIAAFAAKNCAIIAIITPIIANTIKILPNLKILETLFFKIP